MQATVVAVYWLFRGLIFSSIHAYFQLILHGIYLSSGASSPGIYAIPHAIAHQSPDGRGQKPISE
jgi:hypothetical protein